MKLLTALITSALIAGTCTTAHARHGRGNGKGGGNSSQHSGNRQSGPAQIESMPAAELTESQKNGLNFMYQEEKLARDVYVTLGKKWGSRVFLNIQKAEQRHMDAVKTLLKKYSIPIPIDDSNTGTFPDKELQALYDTLIKQGLESNQAAYKVGILVEVTDIKDLEDRMESAPADINAVYSRLLQGSNNHLKAFTRASNGKSSSEQSGNGNGKRGRGNGHGGGHGRGHGGGHGRNR